MRLGSAVTKSVSIAQPIECSSGISPLVSVPLALINSKIDHQTKNRERQCRVCSLESG